MNIRIPDTVFSDIAAHLEAGYPHEACGFLLGREDRTGRDITHILPVENRSTENRGRRFVIDPLDYLKAEQYAAAEGHDLLGIYHSHPDAPSVPSEHDLAFAQPFFSYLIVTIKAGKAADPRIYRLARTAFTEESFHLIPTQP